MNKSDLVPTQLKSQFIDAIDKIIHEVRVLNYQTQHGKITTTWGLSSRNILWRDEVVMVDFDDSRMGSAIQDFGCY